MSIIDPLRGSGPMSAPVLDQSPPRSPPPPPSRLARRPAQFAAATLACAAIAAGFLAASTETARGQTTYYWDSNGATAGFGNTTGTWGSSAFWSTSLAGTAATANTPITSLDTVNFGTTLDYSNAAVGVAAGGVTTGSLVIGGGQTTALTLGTAGNAITIHGGITKNAGSAAFTISSPIVLGAAQTWINSSSTTLSATGGVDMGANTLTVSGAGNVTIPALSGSGGSLVMNGTGLLNLNAASGITYTGTTTINGGGILVGSAGFGTGTGNITINGGWIEQYFGNTFTRALGSGAGQLQITGGTSGFSGQGATSSTFTISGVTNLVWGSTFFNPNVLLLGSSATNTNGKGSLSNGIDLNGADRTITSTQVTDGAASSGFTISGVISSTTGTAGFTKTGVGNLILGSTANTYSGATTISGGWLTVGGSGGLGNGSATNTLIFNGGTLRATAAVTSPATRAVTMTATGVIDNNGQAIGIAGTIGGAGGLTKNGTGTLTLSGTNTYGGVTTVNAGTLAITKEAAFYNGTAASWTAANVNVAAGATLALNVDSAGASGFTAPNLATLLGNISVAASRTVGLQSGAMVALDTSTATGAAFALASPITNSSGTFGGLISVTKTGAGTLVLDQANTYTGTTTVTAGTLRLGSGGATGSLSAAGAVVVGTGATFAVNRSTTVTQGSDFGSLIYGAGSLTNEGGGTLVLNAPTYHTGTTKAASGVIAINDPLAIQNSALDTTGSGTVSVGGLSGLTFGGLSGVTGNLAAVITSGYGGVTGLTLNPQTGSTFTYGGVIADGATGMSLTKTGPGTQVLTGANTFTGVTTLRNGALNLSGTGTIATASGIMLAGGGITLTNTNTAESTLNRIGDSTPITSSAGGTITYTNTTGANLNYAETLGSVALQASQLNVVLTTNQNNATSNSQTLTLAGLTRSGASNTSAVTFSAATTAPQASTGDNMIRVNGVASSTSSGQIIGPWATTGTAAVNQTDYAVYASNGTDAFVTPAGTTLTNPGELGWTSATTAYQFGGANTLTATRSAAALRYTGAAASLSLGTSTFNLETTGILNGGSGLLTIQNGTGGTGGLTTPAGGGSLYLTTGNNAITVSAPINDNGGAVTVVKPISGGTLTLSATTSTYSGGTVIHGGSLQITADANLGGSAGGITLAGGRLNIPGANVTSARTVTVTPAGGQIFVNKNNNFTTSGSVAGSGTLTLLDGGGSGTPSTYTFTSTANTLTGTVVMNSAIVNVNSLTDSANTIVVGGGGGGTFNWGAGATGPLVLNGRAFVISQTASGQTFNLTNSNATAANTITVNKDLIVNGTGTATLSLGGTNTGTNVFAGRITDGPGGAVGVTKTGAGTWILSGTNTYTGNTQPDGSTLTINGRNALPSGSLISFDPASGSAGNGAGVIKLLIDDPGTVSLGNQINVRTLQTSGAASWGVFVGNTSAANGGIGGGGNTGSTIGLGKLNFASITDLRANGNTLNVTGTNGYRLQLGDVDLANNSNTGGGTNPGFTLNPTTAPLTVVGTVRQVAGTPATRTIYASQLRLDGTAAGNVISGAIMNAVDFATNANALPQSVIKANTSTWTLSGTNTYTGGTTITQGKLIFSGANALPTTGTVAVAANGQLSLADGAAHNQTVSALTLTSLATLSLDWTGDNAGDQLTSTADITPTAGSNFAIDLNRTGSPGGSVTLLTGGAGSTLNGSNFYLANTTDYSATLSKTATTVSVGGYSSQTALTTIYWQGNKLAAAATGSVDNAWALSDGTKSNWSSTSTAYTATSLTPGPTANVIFSNAQVGKTQQSTTLGSDVTVNSVVIDDATAVTIAGANGAALTLLSTLSTAGTVTGTPGSAITVTSNAAATSTVSARVALGSNQTWNVASGKTLTVSGIVGGAFSLTKAGAGTVILDGANTYQGDTTISGGILRVGNNTGGTLGGGIYSGAIVNNGTLQIWGTANQTLGGAISGSGSLAKAYNGALTLAGANTYTGRTSFSPQSTAGFTVNVTSFNSVNAGTPLLASSSLGAPTTTANGTIDVGSGAAQATVNLTYLGSGETTDRVVNLLFNGTASQTVTASGAGPLKFTSDLTSNATTQTGSLILTGTGIGEIAGSLPAIATSGLAKQGSGTWILSGSNAALARATSVAAGTLVARSGNALGTGANANVSVTAGAALNYVAATDTPLNIGGTLTINGGTGTAIGGSVGSTATSARIDVAGNALVPTAAVAVNVYGVPGVSRPAGTTTYTLVSGLGGGATTLNSGAYTLGTVFNNTDFTVSSITKSTTSLMIDVTKQTALTNAFYVGGLPGAGTVWAASNGTSASNFSASSGGASQPLVPGSAAAVTIDDASFASATVLGADVAIGGLTISDNTSNFALNADGYALTLGSGGITKSNTVTRTAALAANLVLGASQTWTNSDTGNPLVVSGQVTGANDLAVGGAGSTVITGRLLNGTGTLTKAGNGTLELSGFNGYSGATAVNAGTLELDGRGSINASAAVSIAAGAKLAFNSAIPLTASTTLGGTGTGAGQRAILGGTGTISLALALDNTGDVLSPGNSPGIMPFTTSQTWSSFGYDWELNDWATSVAGTNIDQIQISGGLTLTGATAGSYVVDVLSLTAGNVAGNVANFADATNSWTILTTTSGITGFDAGRWTVDTSGFTSAPAATGTWSVGLSNDSQNLVLNYVAVPEPSTLALAALGLAALGCRLRRRRVTRGSQA